MVAAANSICDHPSFEANVNVNRILKPQLVFVAEVTVKCAACGCVFEFKDLPKRISTRRVGVNLDSTCVSLPIAPLTSEERDRRICAGGHIQVDAD